MVFRPRTLSVDLANDRVRLDGFNARTRHRDRDRNRSRLRSGNRARTCVPIESRSFPFGNTAGGRQFGDERGKHGGGRRHAGALTVAGATNATDESANRFFPGSKHGRHRNSATRSNRRIAVGITVTKNDTAVLVTLVLLVFFSAWDATGKPAFWIALFLLVIVWLNAYSTGQIQPFLDAAAGNPQGSTP